MVARVWAEHGLKPHRTERYQASRGPEFAQKAADTIGLHLNPPANVAVFFVDEKTAIQALDRDDPVLQVQLHFTSIDSLWLNQVELWFAKIERDVIAHGVFTSVADSLSKLMTYIRQLQQNPQDG